MCLWGPRTLLTVGGMGGTEVDGKENIYIYTLFERERERGRGRERGRETDREREKTR